MACLAAATTASAVLNCEGAPARLLHLVADSDDADAMAKLVAQALAVVRPTTTPTFDEIKDVLNMVNCHFSPESMSCAEGSSTLACGSMAPLLGTLKCKLVLSSKDWCMDAHAAGAGMTPAATTGSDRALQQSAKKLKGRIVQV